MASVPFHYIDLRAFCYATEEEPRVVEALRTILPEEIDLERHETRGHHDDRIVVLSARVDTADGMRAMIDRLRELDSMATVLGELDERIDDDCSLYLRLDKQAAFRGEVRLGEGLLLRAKVEAYPARKATAVENAREALGG